MLSSRTCKQGTRQLLLCICRAVTSTLNGSTNLFISVRRSGSSGGLLWESLCRNVLPVLPWPHPRLPLPWRRGNVVGALLFCLWGRRGHPRLPFALLLLLLLFILLSELALLRSRVSVVRVMVEVVVVVVFHLLFLLLLLLLLLFFVFGRSLGR